jgi:hypothetical protein
MNRFGKRLAVILAIALLAQVPTLGQSSARDRRIIRFARNLNVSRLDRGLPGQTFERWLRSVVGGRVTIHWDVDDCGEQDGNPSNPDNLNPPLCANARAQMADGSKLGIAIAVGSHQSGISGKPVVFYAYFGDHHPSKLRELAALIRRSRRESSRKAWPVNLFLAPAVITVGQNLGTAGKSLWQCHVQEKPF